jgi:putative nucleotidyltransferase with HDIG domain
VPIPVQKGGSPKPASLMEKRRRFSLDPTLQRWLIVGGTVIILTIILVTVLIPGRIEMEVGQPSKYDIEAQRDIVDRPSTERLKEEAGREAIKEANLSQANYDISPAASISAEDRVDLIFDIINKQRGAVETWTEESASNIDGRVKSLIPEIVKKIESDSGTRLSQKTVETLLRLSDDEFSAARIGAKQAAGWIMREKRISKETLDVAKKEAKDIVLAQHASEETKAALLEIVEEQISPNLVLNPGKVEQARESAEKQVKPVMILKGQTIIRRGEIATPDHIDILHDLGLLSPTFDAVTLACIIVMIVVLLSGMGVYLYVYRRDICNQTKPLLILGTVTVLTVFLIAVISSIPWDGASFLVPASLGTMLIAILVDSQLSLLAAVAFGVLTGIISGGSLASAVIAMLSGVAGAFAVTRISERSDLMRAGVIVGTTTACVISVVGPLTGNYQISRMWYMGVLNGVLSTVVTIGFLPFFENIFRVTTPIKLLELSNPNQPLLRRLLMEAPGTYHHSIIVGNLAEAAAEAIGADSLLVRVAAYYHDVGKTKRPYFFVENQLMQDNPHDKLAPTLSTLIITSHIKDGVDMASRSGLPESIISIMREHHGTTLVPYFYHKASESAKEEVVDEKDYRYVGPKPQTKESAIVMLADSVEAAVRSLSRPTPGRIEGLIRKIVKERLQDGQFDECDLTLKDLDGVANAFVRVLSGIYHPRIEYPDVVQKDADSKKVHGS